MLKFCDRKVLLTAVDPVPDDMRFAPCTVALNLRELRTIAAAPGHPLARELEERCERANRGDMVAMLRRAGGL